MKVLPKFRGSRSKLLMPLCTLIAWCENPSAPEPSLVKKRLDEIGSSDEIESKMMSAITGYLLTARRAVRMLRDLRTDGFASFG